MNCELIVTLIAKYIFDRPMHFRLYLYESDRKNCKVDTSHGPRNIYAQSQ